MFSASLGPKSFISFPLTSKLLTLWLPWVKKNRLPSHKLCEFVICTLELARPLFRVPSLVYVQVPSFFLSASGLGFFSVIINWSISLVKSLEKLDAWIHTSCRVKALVEQMMLQLMGRGEWGSEEGRKKPPNLWSSCFLFLLVLKNSFIQLISFTGCCSTQ